MVPDLNLIVVTTGGGLNFDDVVPHILGAFVDQKKPLPANPAGAAKLAQVLPALAQPPAAQALPALPEAAAAISGKVFRLDENPFGVESLRLDFDGSSAAGFQVAFADGTQSPRGAVGLDGVYRLTPGMNLDRASHPYVDFQNLSVGLRGQWVDAQTFWLEYNTVANYYSYRLKMQFEGDQVAVAATELTSGNEAGATFSGRLQQP